MSKMKRKWLRVIEYEETGVPIDELTRQQLLETHPDLPLLHQSQDVGVGGGVPQAQMLQAQEAMQAQLGAFEEELGAGLVGEGHGLQTV